MIFKYDIFLCQKKIVFSFFVGISGKISSSIYQKNRIKIFFSLSTFFYCSWIKMSSAFALFRRHGKKRCKKKTPKLKFLLVHRYWSFTDVRLFEIGALFSRSLKKTSYFTPTNQQILLLCVPLYLQITSIVKLVLFL